MGRGISAMLPYNELLLKCTQSSTNAPATAYTLGNTFGATLGTPAWARTGAGVYTLTLTGAWTANKTVVFVQPNVTEKQFSVAYTSADVITLTVKDLATPSAADSGAFDILVRVYD